MGRSAHRCGAGVGEKPTVISGVVMLDVTFESADGQNLVATNLSANPNSPALGKLPEGGLPSVGVIKALQ